eukprot:TRINITY_DN140_c0_g1_i1.p1 TRINITY_DN140_c0_g1~~TRINITY_DN140_c0_g1_i1.p1  ORF type:complete len:209 (+),score=29.67 TRINITY_DN140_c0_g1_i1:920-1546(+)
MHKWRRLPRIFLNQPESSSITMDLPRSTSGSATTITDLPQSITTAVWQPTYIFLDHHESSWTITDLPRSSRVFASHLTSLSMITSPFHSCHVFFNHHASSWDHRGFFSTIMRLFQTSCVFVDDHESSLSILCLRRRSRVFIDDHWTSSIIMRICQPSCIIFINHREFLSTITSLHQPYCVIFDQSSWVFVDQLFKERVHFQAQKGGGR